MTTLDDTRHCPMCEDAAKKILELEQILISCRGSVKTDLNQYERLLVAKEKLGEHDTPTYVAASEESNRLFDLMEKIDAITPLPKESKE